MSLQMVVARGVLHVRKQWGRLASYERLKSRNLPDPPPAVARAHAVEVVDIDGVRAVWLDRGSDGGVIVYLHGGTYITGPEEDQWQWFGRLCRAAS